VTVTVAAAGGTAVQALALDAVGVCKRYGDRDALSDVDLVARPGVLHGLLGPNGAGKTTLMRVLLGLVRRDAGSVRLLGRDLDRAAGGRVPHGVAGFVETPAFYPYLSGRRNLALLARLDDGPRSDRKGRVTRALEQVGLSDQADVGVAGYSAGMRQRLGLAAALLRTPRLLFLDEPTSSLDPAGARDVRALARRMADEGAAVVLSSHDMSEVEELCAAITVIDRGRVIFSGTVEALRARAPAAVHAMRTSDDLAALMVATGRPGVKVKAACDGDGGLEVSADVSALDAYVIALGRAGVAVRVLERRARSLESLFLELTGHADRRAVAPVSSDAREALPARAVAS
jgi:ABC-2 type transport system ATP-binding protein